MRAAERERVPIYVHAQTGTGKTAAVNFYYRNKRVCMLSGIKGFLDQMPPVGSIEEDTVVIDDMSFIVDTQSQDYVKGLIRSGEKHLVMLGRCVMPH
jgi:LuxR family maltose regulon positive regulatory protein